MDGRVLAEALDPSFRPDAAEALLSPPPTDGDGRPNGDGRTEEDDEAVKQRLADLGYL